MFGKKPKRAATNAPRDWPAVEVSSWNAENDAFNYLQIGAALAKGFEAQNSDAKLAFYQNRLYDDGVLRVPLEVTEGDRRTAVFAYAQASQEAQAHYSGARAALRQREGMAAVYYAPEPIQPARGASVIEPLDSSLFTQAEDGEGQGEFAVWWPTDEEPRFAGSPAAEHMTRACQALDGYGSFMFTSFVNDLDLMEKKPEAMVALPDEPLVVPVDGPGGLRLRMYASAERGMWFAFDQATTSVLQRNRFLKLWAESAEWFRGELKGVPPRDEDVGPALAWWTKTRDDALKAEAEGSAGLVVGRLADSPAGGVSESVSTTEAREGAPSERLMELVYDALDHAVETVQELGGGDGEPALHAFLWLRDDQNTYRTTFFMLNEPEAVKACRKSSEKWPSADRGVLVCDSYLRDGAQRTDALIARAYERGTPQTHVFALRYHLPKKGQPFSVIGNPMLFAREDPLFD